MKVIGTLLLVIGVALPVGGVVLMTQGVEYGGIGLVLWIGPVIVGILMFLFAGRVGEARRRNEMLRTGLPGLGTITVIDDTGETVNEDPVARLTLLVVPDDGSAAFESVGTTRVPRLKAPEEGQQVPVRYDPNDHSLVAIDGPIRRAER